MLWSVYSWWVWWSGMPVFWWKVVDVRQQNMRRLVCMCTCVCVCVCVQKHAESDWMHWKVLAHFVWMQLIDMCINSCGMILFCLLAVAISTRCPEDMFQCDDGNGSGPCLTYDKTCNGIPDCLNGADEDKNFCGKYRPAASFILVAHPCRFRCWGQKPSC